MPMEQNQQVVLKIWNDAPTKSEIRTKVTEFIKAEGYTPLQKYIFFKALEQFVKQALENKIFRKEVKDSYLQESGGALDQSELHGVTIKTRDLTKQNELKKDYIYSEDVVKMESEIQLMEMELKLKKDGLKGRKLFEINNGTAQLVSSDVQDLVNEVDDLENFDLTILFKS